MAIESMCIGVTSVNEADPRASIGPPAQKAAVAEAAEAAGLDPEILLSIGPPGRGKSMPAPSPKPAVRRGSQSNDEVDASRHSWSRK